MMRRERLTSVSLGQLRVFATVAREQSFVKAASVIHLTEATVSEQIKGLETIVGTTLLNRSRGRRGVSLTEAGRILLRTCTEVFDALERGGQELDELSGSVVGTVNLGTGTTFSSQFLPHILAAFHHTYPDVVVHTEIAGHQRRLASLLRGELDLAVGFGKVDDAKFVSEPWGECDLILVGPPGHRLAAPSASPLRELAQEWLILDDPPSRVSQLIEQMATDASTSLHVIMRITNDDAQLAAVSRGLGLAVQSRYSAAPFVARGQMAELHVEGFPLLLEWYVVHPARPLSIAVQALKDHLLTYRGRLNEVALPHSPGGESSV